MRLQSNAAGSLGSTCLEALQHVIRTSSALLASDFYTSVCGDNCKAVASTFSAPQHKAGRAIVQKQHSMWTPHRFHVPCREQAGRASRIIEQEMAFAHYGQLLWRIYFGFPDKIAQGSVAAPQTQLHSPMLLTHCTLLQLLSNLGLCADLSCRLFKLPNNLGLSTELSCRLFKLPNNLGLSAGAWL